MTLLPLPWLEASILIALVGALCVSQLRDPLHAWSCGLVFTGGVLATSLVACFCFYYCQATNCPNAWSIQEWLVGRSYLAIDELSAPLLPVLSLLHFLTALATGRTKMRRFSLSWSLVSVATRLGIFSCQLPWVLVALLAVGTVPPYLELRNRGQSTRVYAFHMALFVGLLILGCGIAQAGAGEYAPFGAALLMTAVLTRSGAVPLHCWLTDWFEHASFGNALLFVAPLVGVYAAIRLVLPIAPDWMLTVITLFSLVTAIYAAAMAVTQSDARRFFAYLLLSHASLVLVGLELHTSISLTGALALWIAVSLSLGGFGLTLRALEARYGRLSLVEFQGLYDHSPMLAICFLLTGLASVGFPGTFGFLGTELLVDGAIQDSPYVGVIVVLTAALNGIAVMKAYFRLFTGKRHVSSVPLEVGLRERFAVLLLATLILGGGLFPQPWITSRHQAAVKILNQRKAAVEAGQARLP
jgi:NADH-quinone oxidoreductase subunit M